MAQIKISILNDSTQLKDAAIAACVPAWQEQITHHFGPVWNVDADLVFVPQGQQAVPGSWWLSFLDDSQKAAELGIHDTTPAGRPVGKVFMKAELENDLKWSVTASHELLEMLIDPDINRSVLVPGEASGVKLYTLEVCDAVEDDADGYEIDGVFVSNFVLPSYFRPGEKAQKFDYLGKLQGPVPALRAGGYVNEFDVATGAGWVQNSAETTGTAHRGQVRTKVPGSRSERRGRPRSAWQPSDTRLRPGPSG